MDLEKLSYEVIDVKPLDFDCMKGYGDTWEVAFSLSDQEIEDGEFFPIYNAIYPLGARFAVPRRVRSLLSQTTIIAMHDAHYLALTGCGMDYSWEICESYMNLGYFPPAHFCRLPAMAGRGDSERDKRIIAGCLESLTALGGRYQRDLEYLKKY